MQRVIHDVEERGKQSQKILIWRIKIRESTKCALAIPSLLPMRLRGPNTRECPLIAGPHPIEDGAECLPIGCLCKTQALAIQASLQGVPHAATKPICQKMHTMLNTLSGASQRPMVNCMANWCSRCAYGKERLRSWTSRLSYISLAPRKPTAYADKYLQC